MLNQYFAHELFNLQQQELEKRARQGDLAGLAVSARRRRRAETERYTLHREVEAVRHGLEGPAENRPLADAPR